MRSVAAGLVVIAAAATLAGCGGSGASSPTSSSNGTSTPRRVCEGARAAAARTLGRSVTATVTATDPVDIRCRLRAGTTRIAIEAQASAQAWTEFDTTQVHQIQAYEEGSRHVPGQSPIQVPAPGTTLAMWIPAQRQVFATNGGESTAGSYVTVTVHGSRSAGDRPLARAVTLAVLAVAPRGPKP